MCTKRPLQEETHLQAQKQYQINYKVIEIKTRDKSQKNYKESTDTGNTASHQLSKKISGEESR